MPLVQEQVEHLARPIRSKVSPKEKKLLTSKVNTGLVPIGTIIDSDMSGCGATGMSGAISVTSEAGAFGVTEVTG